MTSVEEMLRDADPLRHEPPQREADRAAIRQAVLAHAAGAVPATRFRGMPASIALAALVLAFVLAGARFWPRGTAEVIAAVRFEARLAETSPGLGLRQVRIRADNRTIYLHPEAIVTNSDIAQAHAVEGPDEHFSVAITFTADGAAKMLRATSGHLGRPIAILFDGEVALAPTVRSPMSGSAMISGDFTKSEVERIASGVLGR